MTSRTANTWPWIIAGTVVATLILGVPLICCGLPLLISSLLPIPPSVASIPTTRATTATIPSPPATTAALSPTTKAEPKPAEPWRPAVGDILTLSSDPKRDVPFMVGVTRDDASWMMLHNAAENRKALAQMVLDGELIVVKSKVTVKVLEVDSGFQNYYRVEVAAGVGKGKTFWAPESFLFKK